MSKISVIIPVYNVEKYLVECLDSVLAQTFSDIEIICIDDGSTDKSLKILRQYAARDKRIKIITQKNSGVVVARNRAISMAKSEYIYPIDSDDVIAPDTLQKLYNAMIAGRGDIITCRVQCFGRDNYYCAHPVPNKINMSAGNCLVNAALFRKSDFDASGGYDTAFSTALEDYDLWLNMVFRLNKKIYRVPEILFFYRLKDKSDARNYQHRAEHKKLLKKLFAKYPSMRLYHILFYIRKLFVFTPTIPEQKQIKLLYFNEQSNFGDQLNPVLFGLFGYNVVKSDRSNCDMVAIGSLMENFFVSPHRKTKKKPVIVYGSGFMLDKKQDEYLYRALDVRAVRGYNTLKRLENLDNVKISPNVVIADPGLLAVLLLCGEKPTKKYKLGIIPHCVDRDNPLLNKIKCKDSVVIDITSHPISVMRKIAECENIISSAMHGLIAADAAGVPNIRMVLSDKIIGGDYKFDDYYSAFGIKKHKTIDLRKQNFTDADIDDIAKNYKISKAQVLQKQRALLDAFPFDVH